MIFITIKKKNKSLTFNQQLDPKLFCENNIEIYKQRYYRKNVICALIGENNFRAKYAEWQK